VKVKHIIFFLLLFGFTGYLRERFFEHMNIIIHSVYFHEDAYAEIHSQVPVLMKPFLTWSYPALYYSKYLFTLAWTAIFFLISYFTIKIITKNKKLLRFLFYAYALLLGLAALSMAFGYFVNQRLNEDEYTLSRWLLGVAQSPLICLILVASSKLYNTSFQNKNTTL
jgi:hypothetical protein